MSEPNVSVSLVDNKLHSTKSFTFAATAFTTLGFLSILAATFGAFAAVPNLGLAVILTSFLVGLVLDISGNVKAKPVSGQNQDVMTGSLTNKGLVGWSLGIGITAFYVVLYWHGHLLANLTRLFDSLSFVIRGKNADQWFLYGSFYTLAVLLMGARVLVKYRHSRYQKIRTLVIIAAQLFLAYLIPALLQLFHQPEYYFSYFWPLKPEYLYPWKLNQLWGKPQALAHFMAWWGIFMSFVGVPVFTYLWGKRWYCSWVCGCGGLANTAGDQFRHLSNKSLNAWKVERYSIHTVLLLIVILTAMLWANSAMGGEILKSASGSFSKWYGFFIGSLFSGVVGVGFYPLFGTRVWCRFGCPQAAILGIIQKFFSRFRITVNGGQCISCGNCSTYCEMGIDVKWYAQRGQDFVRASCVGCGMCSTVCPRGVLKLENSSIKVAENQGSWHKTYTE